MTTAAYDAWADKPSAERVVLADIQFGEKLEGWINDSYADTVIADAPVVYLRLDDPTGPTADDAMNAHDGTYNGSPLLGQTGLISDGLCPSFDGIDDFVSVPDHAALDITTNLTMEAWINADTWPVGFPRILCKGFNSTTGYQLLVDQAAGPKIAVQLEGLTPATFQSTANVTTGTTYHIVVTYDGSNVRIYINGALDSTTGATGSIATRSEDLFIGQRGDGTARWDGKIDEVAVYSGTVLNGTQITEHYDLRNAVSNVYQTSWSPLITDVPTPGGVMTQLDGVKENATSLTSRGSITDVSTNPGSFFYDTAAAILYVRTTNSVDPDTLSWVGVIRRFTFATAPKAFVGGPLYEPRLTTMSLPALQGRHEDFLTGLVTYPAGDLELNNADGLFDELATRYDWEGYHVTFRSGGEALLRSDYEIMATMVIAQAPAPSDTTARIQLRSLSGALDLAVPTETVDDFYGTLTAGYQDNVGRYLPLVYGRVYDLPLRLLGRATDPGPWFFGGFARYIITDPTAHGSAMLPSTVAIRAKDRVTGEEFALDPGAGHFVIGSPAYYVDIQESAFSPDTYDFYADGLTNNSATIGTIVYFLLRKAGIPDSDLDLASFTQAAADCPWELGVYVPDLTTVGEVIRPLLRSTLSTLTRPASGKWTLSVWDPSSDWANVPHYLEAELLRWEASTDLQAPIRYQVRVRCEEQIGKDNWTVISASDGATQFGRPYSQTIDVDSALANRSDARVLADRLLAMATAKIVRVDVELPTRAATLGLLDKIRVTRSRAPGGALDRSVFTISAYLKRLSDARLVATIDNQRGMGQKVKRWAPSGLTWATATDAQRLTYGRWSGPASTHEHSYWW